MGDDNADPYALGFPLCAHEPQASDAFPHHHQRFRLLDLLMQSGSGSENSAKEKGLFNETLGSVKGKLGGGGSGSDDDHHTGGGSSGDDDFDDDNDLFGNGGSLRSYAALPGLYEPCREGYLTAYLNRPDVRAALHVDHDRPWVACDDLVFMMLD